MATVRAQSIGSTSNITGLAYINYKKTNVFVVGDSDGKMTLFDKDMKSTAGSFDVKLNKDEEESNPVKALAFFNHSIITAVCEPNYCFAIRVNESDGKVHNTMYEFDSTVDAVAVAAPGQNFAYVGDGNRVVFFTKEGQVGNDLKIQAIKSPQHRAVYATYDNAGKYLIVHGSDGSLHVVDGPNQMVVKSFHSILPLTADAYPAVKSDEFTLPIHSAFQTPFTGSQSNFAVPTITGVAVFNSKSWSQNPAEITKREADEQWIGCQFSPNNALLAVLTNTRKVHVIDMLDHSHPVLTTVDCGVVKGAQQGVLTRVQWGPGDTAVDLVVTGTNGVVLAVSNLIDALPHGDNGQAKISHTSTAEEIAQYVGQLTKAKALLLTPTKKKFVVADESDDEEVVVVRRTPSKVVDTSMKDGNNNKEERKGNTDVQQHNHQTPPDENKKRKAPTQTDPTLMSDAETAKHNSIKRQRRHGHSDDDDALSDSGDEDGKDDDEVDFRDSLKTLKLTKDSYVHLDKIEELIKEDLDDHYKTQFRKSFLMTRDTHIQAPFMPTSTATIENKTVGDKLTLLHSSEHGNVISRLHNKDTTIGVVLNATKRVERMSLAFGRTPFNMATMDLYGILLASPSYFPDPEGLSKADRNTRLPSQIHYQSFDSEREVQFTFDLPSGEEVECIALSKDIIAVATNRGFLRLYDLTGIEMEIMSLPGRVLTMTAKGAFLSVFYHNNSVPLAGSHNISMQLIHTEMLHVLYDANVAISPLSQLQWVYISSTGVIYTGDSEHIIRMFSTARGNSWKVISDLTQHIPEKGYSYWPLYVEYTPDVDTSATKPNQPPQTQTWSHRLYSYELYNRLEPIPQPSMPNPKPVKMKIPFSRFSSATATPTERNIQLQFEPSLRERVLWDELVSTHGQSIPPRLNQQYDTPWIQLCLQMATKGQTVAAIYAAKQVRDVELLFKTVEKLNTMPHLPNVDLLIIELKSILAFKRQFKKLGLFPYQVPLPHAAMYKSKEIATLATQPQHAAVNPFASPQVNRSAAPTAGYAAAMAASSNGPSPPSSSTPAKTDTNPFKPQSTPVSAASSSAPNPFRK